MRDEAIKEKIFKNNVQARWKLLQTDLEAKGPCVSAK